MLRPQLLPDELVGSYIGVIARINGIASADARKREALTRARISEWCHSFGSAAQAPLEHLAEVAGVEPRHIEHHHTLSALSGQRMVVRAGPPVGASSNSLGNESTRPEMCLCTDCVASDLSNYGRSYWRREHQLPGMYWCAKHKRGLRAVKGKASLLSPPSSVAEEADEFDYEWVKTLWSHPSVVRYFDVLHAFLDLGETVTASVVRDALRERSRPLGYQLHPNGGVVAPGTRAILSHDARVLFPAEWLERTFPSYTAQAGNKLQVWLDGTLWMPIPPTNVAGYALAASLLFPSGDVFLQEVRRQQSRSGASAAREDESAPSAVGPAGPACVQFERSSFGAGNRTTSAPKKQPGKCRQWTPQQKLELVRRSYEPGMNVATVAREADIMIQQLYLWT